MDKSKYRVYAVCGDGKLYRLATPPDGWTLEGIKKLKVEVLEERIGKVLFGVRENSLKEKEIDFINEVYNILIEHGNDALFEV